MFESVRLAGNGTMMYQYFAVSEWNVEGTGMCNGHASRCAPAPGEAIAQDKVHEMTMLLKVSCIKIMYRPAF